MRGILNDSAEGSVFPLSPAPQEPDPETGILPMDDPKLRPAIGDPLLHPPFPNDIFNRSDKFVQPVHGLDHGGASYRVILSRCVPQLTDSFSATSSSP